MIVTIDRRNSQKHEPLLAEMFRQRARVFRDKLRWDVEVMGEMERDRYDDEDAVYILYRDGRTRRLVGSLRLRPTTGPTLLADTFADTIPDAAALSAPTIWECTRFCVEEDSLGPDGRRGAIFASAILFVGLGELAIQAGIASILGNFDATMLRLYRRIGCDVEVLGQTQMYGDTVYLGLFPVSELILGRIKARFADALLEPAIPAHELAA